MKIALVGASGNVGQRITAEATARGHDVTAIARKVDDKTAEGRADGGHVRWQQGDLADPETLAPLLSGHDAVVVSVRFQGLDFAKALEAVRTSGVKRLVVVGGAASLEVEPGVVLLDTPDFPDFIKPEATPARAALNVLRGNEELDWTFISPSMWFEPGERTGTFRLGDDLLLTAEDGRSHISYEDFSVALVDELEKPRHIRKRFTVGY